MSRVYIDFRRRRTSARTLLLCAAQPFSHDPAACYVYKYMCVRVYPRRVPRQTVRRKKEQHVSLFAFTIADRTKSTRFGWRSTHSLARARGACLGPFLVAAITITAKCTHDKCVGCPVNPREVPPSSASVCLAERVCFMGHKTFGNYCLYYRICI